MHLPTVVWVTFKAVGSLKEVAEHFKWTEEETAKMLRVGSRPAFCEECRGETGMCVSSGEKFCLRCGVNLHEKYKVFYK